MGIWDTILANGVVAAIAAVIAILIAHFYTRRLEERRAQTARDLAAAAELYRVYGEFYAAWKEWNAHMDLSGEPKEPKVHLDLTHDRRSELLKAAAAAEGGFESLFLRLSNEHHLDTDQLRALRCLRGACKELRRAIEAKRKLLWWRRDSSGKPGPEGFHEYMAFKKLTSFTVGMLVGGRGRRMRLPGARIRLEALLDITGGDQGSGKWLAEAERLPFPCDNRR